MNFKKTLLLLSILLMLNVKPSESFYQTLSATASMYDEDKDEVVNQINFKSAGHNSAFKKVLRTEAPKTSKEESKEEIEALSNNSAFQDNLRADTPIPTNKDIPEEVQNAEEFATVATEFFPEPLNVRKLVDGRRSKTRDNIFFEFYSILDPVHEFNTKFEEEKLKKAVDKEIDFLEFSINSIRKNKFEELYTDVVAKMKLELALLYLNKNRVMDAYNLLYDIIHSPNIDVNTFSTALLNFGAIYEHGCEEIDINMNYAKDSYKAILKRPLGVSRETRREAQLRLDCLEEDNQKYNPDDDIIQKISELSNLIYKIKEQLENTNILSSAEITNYETIINRAKNFITSNNRNQKKLSDFIKQLATVYNDINNLFNKRRTTNKERNGECGQMDPGEMAAAESTENLKEDETQRAAFFKAMDGVWKAQKTKETPSQIQISAIQKALEAEMTEFDLDKH
ncbi:MAG: hypothetical protein P4L22_00705 [Candidatus Babeliales bacterium]|nr:hypothetical protein [Candidatus Babeliales bacterium]